MNNIISGFVGLVIGIVICGISNKWFSNDSDKINIIGIILNVIVIFILAIFLERHRSNSQALKAFFIEELGRLKSEYLTFVELIEDNKLSKEKVTSRFKHFSVAFIQVEYFHKSELSVECNLQSKNRTIHFLICNNENFDNLKPNDFAKIPSDKLTLVQDNLKDLKHEFVNQVIRVTKK